MYSPSAQTGWSGSTVTLIGAGLPVVAAGCRRVQVQRPRGRRDERVDVGLVKDEAIQQPVVDGVAVGDLEARARHPRVHHVDLGRQELEDIAIDLHLVLELAWSGYLRGRRDRVREDAVPVLELTARLLLGLDADVQPLDEVAVVDLCLADAPQPAHVDARASWCWCRA